ncbi:hypothetical protein [Pontibacter sp. G13]|uniref:hypothetical protein n=1 Tax=Pontibacter sp. G13 TaxID=3074898 RepID=UPI002889F5B6|nr:hypothetical protein [Pontibacter sp. G13]WNJ18761.1 hypothetical protein RJD25_28225 [Pontibacter sp. G13]
MGKRTLRIQLTKPDQDLGSLVGQEAHVITWEGSTFFGDIRFASNSTLTIEDKNITRFNRRRHRHHVALTDIREIIVDKATKW